MCIQLVLVLFSMVCVTNKNAGDAFRKWHSYVTMLYFSHSYDCVLCAELGKCIAVLYITIYPSCVAVLNKFTMRVSLRSS